MILHSHTMRHFIDFEQPQTLTQCPNGKNCPVYCGLVIIMPIFCCTVQKKSHPSPFFEILESSADIGLFRGRQLHLIRYSLVIKVYTIFDAL